MLYARKCVRTITFENVAGSIPSRHYFCVRRSAKIFSVEETVYKRKQKREPVLPENAYAPAVGKLLNPFECLSYLTPSTGCKFPTIAVASRTDRYLFDVFGSLFEMYEELQKHNFV